MVEGELVLVVEDNQSIRTVVCEMAGEDTGFWLLKHTPGGRHWNWPQSRRQTRFCWIGNCRTLADWMCCVHCVPAAVSRQRF